MPIAAAVRELVDKLKMVPPRVLTNHTANMSGPRCARNAMPISIANSLRPAWGARCLRPRPSFSIRRPLRPRSWRNGSTGALRSTQRTEVFTKVKPESGTDGKQTFQTAHKIEWIIGAGVNGFGGVLEQDNYLFQAPLSFYSRPGKLGALARI